MTAFQAHTWSYDNHVFFSNKALHCTWQLLHKNVFTSFRWATFEATFINCGLESIAHRDFLLFCAVQMHSLIYFDDTDCSEVADAGRR